MVDNEEDRVIAVGQGYINLDDLRVMVISGYNTALERGVNYERLP
jgi:hypothetical protein